MDTNKEAREIPSLKVEIKFICKVITKRINMMKYILDVHFGHNMSKRIRATIKLDIDVFMGNTKDALKIVERIENKNELDYIPHDLDELILALSLLNRVELSAFQHIANIYRDLKQITNF